MPKWAVLVIGAILMVSSVTFVAAVIYSSQWCMDCSGSWFTPYINAGVAVFGVGLVAAIWGAISLRRSVGRHATNAKHG